MEVYKDSENNLLIKANALDYMKSMSSDSIDLIFADPPYFLSNDGVTCKSGKMVSVNKGDWDKVNTFNDVHSFNIAWLTEAKRILKPNGTLFVSGTMHNIYSVGFALQTLEYKIINDIAWFKVNPPPNLSCRFFTHSTETILWAKKNHKAKHTFNYQTMKAIDDPSVGKQMLSLWKITPPKPSEKKHGKHPTQKPLQLLNRIILAATNEGDVVLDPFLGSGTTAVAALINNRKFIGIDLESKYLDIAVARLNEVIKQGQANA